MTPALTNPAKQWGPGRIPAVPYVAMWSAETEERPKVIETSRGVGFADERILDRDTHGVLWTRMTMAPGRGKPLFAEIHALRQRRAMQRMLCQVCAGPADMSDDDGALWLLSDESVEGVKDEPLTVAEPPICAACAEQSMRVCPRLRQGRSLLRAQLAPVVGVHGAIYAPAIQGPRLIDVRAVGFAEPAITRTVASKLLRQLIHWSPTFL